MIKLRQYQKEAVKSVLNYFKTKKGNPIVALPTGTGKSLIIAALIRYYTEHLLNKRVLILTHVKELLEQNAKTTNSFCNNPDIGFYSAGLNKRDIFQPIIFAGIASVYKKHEELTQIGHFDLIIIDECHLVPDNKNTMYRKLLNEISTTCRVVGLSATPYRLNSGLLTNGKIFDNVCYDGTKLDDFNRFIDDGFLSPLIARETKQQLDISKVHKRGGDYIQKELQLAVDKYSITKNAIEEMIELAKDRKHWLIFSTGVDHSEHIVNELWKHKIPAASIDYKCTSLERYDRIQNFRNGQYRALVNANILTTGFDFPGIDMIGMLRPMCSPGLWVQSLGRGTRPCEGKDNCLVLDYAGNTRRLGPINDVILPTGKTRSGKGHAPIKKCPKCNALVHLSLKECQSCGYAFPVSTNLDDKADSLKLIATKNNREDNWIAVNRVTYISYGKYKDGRVSKSLKVTYFCKNNITVYEWINFNSRHHYPRYRAGVWWRQRSMSTVPTTLQEALNRLADLTPPKFIKVRKVKNFNEITDIRFK